MVITNPDTIVLGMGLATIVPQNGIVPVKVQNVKGVEISDVVFDAGPVNSPALLQIGNPAASRQSDPGRPERPLRRVPDRRRPSRQGDDQPRRQLRRRHPRQHLGLAS